MAIRATWGNLTNTSIHIAFLLGYSRLVQSFIKMEYNVHKDLIQEDFIDRYRNNTLKTIMGFNWAASYCRQAKFVLFVDDDYYVNIPNLINLIENIRKSKNQNVFIGHNQTHTKVQRNKNNKWYVSTEDYPTCNTNWPPFISGGSMLLSMDMVTKFANTFPYVKMISLDDVYLGMVAKILKIKLTHDERFSIRFVHLLHQPK
ncbi:beta-1,3-galactosyltransferase brn-like [Mytilus californianus]|uniref:beta-1,3-galactosyltransferase brn-like n=1 Tax=Mytilus californianus TaxID=6549 RepID=UPI0022469CEC|nr:beta-1,3-galactosyltransferase brn-like [Mytilus californianus]